MDNWDEILDAFKSITVWDIIGALCLFGSLFMGFFFVLIFS